MGKEFQQIDERIQRFIEQQRVFFVSTVIALLATIWAGIRGRRRLHFALAALLLALLYTTIRLTRLVVINTASRACTSADFASR